VPFILLTESSFSSLQPEATAPSTGEPSAAPSGGGGGGAGAGGGLSMLLPFAVMFGVFYFLILRPQQKRQREVDDMLKALRRGDKVRTSGGIKGEIADINDTEVNLIIADKVKINVLRSHIASRIERPSAEGTAEDGKKSTAG
jgi:preprotein translocase subunit YajC